MLRSFSKLFILLRDDADAGDADDTPSRGRYQDLSGRSIARNSHSEECFSLAKSWFDNCQKSHTKCQANLETRLPTRLVCLDDGSYNDDFFCLRLQRDWDSAQGLHIIHIKKTPTTLYSEENSALGNLRMYV